MDTTNFHPELGAVVMEEKIKEDVEKTREVWGDYVRPHERLVRSFARRLMEGTVDDRLRDYSLVCVRKPGKLDKIWETLIRKFLGIDMNLTPDLGLINKVLSDLTLHDENVILVVDADSVKDLEQYRQFVGLLQRYHIKVILRHARGAAGLAASAHPAVHGRRNRRPVAGGGAGAAADARAGGADRPGHLRVRGGAGEANTPARPGQPQPRAAHAQRGRPARCAWKASTA